MKKLIVLSLVAVMASLASATITLTMDGYSSTVAPLDGMDIVSDGSLDILAVLATTETNYDVQFDVIPSPESTLALVTGGTNFPAVWMFGNTWTGVPSESSARLSGGAYMANAAGTACFDSLVITGFGKLKITEVLGDGVTKVISTVNIIPEPMTLGLLGLGGLFLRRRK